MGYVAPHWYVPEFNGLTGPLEGLAYWTGGTRPPATTYRQYVRDLYGTPSTDWMPVFNAGLLVCLVALPLLIGWLVVR